MLNPDDPPAEQVEADDSPPLSARVPKNISSLIAAGEGTRFKKGFSGNPKGRPPTAGASIREFWNLMAGWTRDELKAVFDDPDASAAKLSAAKSWLTAIEEGADHSLINIVEFTSGRATACLEVSVASDWNNDGKVIIDPETILMQQRLAKQADEIKVKSLPAPDSAQQAKCQN
jgi:hypothetical protein